MKKANWIFTLLIVLCTSTLFSRGLMAGSIEKSTATKAAPAKVNLNKADKAALESLPGIGPATADRILKYRADHGPFRSVDELLLVRGIGAKRLAKLRPLISV